MHTLDTASAAPPRSPARAGRITWLLVAPLFLWVAAFVIAPTLIMFVYSFCERGTLGGVVFNFTLANYAAVFDPTYLQIVVRSIFFAGLTTAICLAMGYPVAYFIGRASEKSRNLLLMMVMIPFWTSFLIRTYAWVTSSRTRAAQQRGDWGLVGSGGGGVGGGGWVCGVVGNTRPGSPYPARSTPTTSLRWATPRAPAGRSGPRKMGEGLITTTVPINLPNRILGQPGRRVRPGAADRPGPVPDRRARRRDRRADSP
jgi:hypothetical protein